MPVTLYIYVPLHCYSSLYIDPILLYIQVKIKQHTAALIYHATAIYVPERNIPTNATYANYSKVYNQTTMSIYI